MSNSFSNSEDEPISVRSTFDTSKIPPVELKLTVEALEFNERLRAH
jgi:hypothetical protein